MKRKIILLVILSIVNFINCAFFQVPDEIKKMANENLMKIHNQEMPITIPDTDIEHPKVSIVVPIFNGEKYLKDSLASLQYQTLKEIEMIFVNDGSTDKTLKILKEFEKKDKRVKVHDNKRNRGILYSRMIGALKSKGEYITFMDVDDMYFNFNILEDAYLKAKTYDIDLLQFNNFQGNYTEEYGFTTFMVFTTKYQEKKDQVLHQPEIKNNFFYSFAGHDLLSGIIYDKLYSKQLIKKMANIMGKECIKENLSYMEDFIIIFSAARAARSYMLMGGIGGAWHWANNPDGMTANFEVINGKMKYPEKVNKKMRDNLYINERIFNITENEPDADVLIVSTIALMAKSEMHMEVIAVSSQAERYMNLMLRYINWKYATKENIEEKVKKIAWNIAIIRKDEEFFKKYHMFYEEQYKKMGFGDEIVEPEKNKKTKKKKKKPTINPKLQEEPEEDL